MGIGNKVAFYHVSSGPRPQHIPEDWIRLYINVKRENIAELSNELVNAFGDEQFYFRFIADNQLDTVERTESIVIYENGRKINRTLQIIEKIRKQNPKIFENSANMTNPFLKKVCKGTVSFAPGVSGKYIDHNRREQNIVPSFNNELSVALGESFIEAAYDMVRNHRDIRKNMNKEFLENMHIYDMEPFRNNKEKFEDSINAGLGHFAYTYRFIEPKHKAEFIQKVKENLLEAKSRNPILDINTDEKIYDDDWER